MELSRTESAETLIRSIVGSYALTPAGVYFDQGSGDYREGVIKYFDLATRKVHLVRQLSARKASGLSWSIGERALLVPLNELQSSELVLIENPF